MSIRNNQINIKNNISPEGQPYWHSVVISIAGVLSLVFGLKIYDLHVKQLSFFAILALFGIILAVPIRWCLYLLFLLYGVEGALKLISGYNPVVHVAPDLIIVSLWLRCLMGFLLNRSGFKFRPPPLSVLFLIHFLWFGVIILNPNSLSLYSSLAGAKLYLTIVSLFFFGYYLSTSITQVQKFMIPWVLICLIQVVFSLYQSWIGPSSVTSIAPAYEVALRKYYGYAFRPFGLGSQPGSPAVFIDIAAPFVIYFMFHSRNFIVSAGLLLMVPLCGITLIMCQIRSALLRAILGSGLYILCMLSDLKRVSKRLRRMLFGFTGALGLILILATPKLMSDLTDSRVDNKRAIARSLSLFDYKVVSKARVGALDRLIDYAKMAPMGVGLSRVGSAAGVFSHLIKEDRTFSAIFFADNLWIHMLLDIGIPGMLLMSIIFTSIMFKGFIGWRFSVDPEFRSIQAALLVGLGAILLGGYGAETVLYNPEGPFFWFFSGAMLRLSELSRLVSPEI